MAIIKKKAVKRAIGASTRADLIEKIESIAASIANRTYILESFGVRA
jgi:hypothetical protein